MLIPYMLEVMVGRCVGTDPLTAAEGDYNIDYNAMKSATSQNSNGIYSIRCEVLDGIDL